MTPRARTIVIIAGILCVAGAARADGDGRVHQGRFLRLATGVAYLRESWSPSGGTADAVHTGWGPTLEVAVGKFVRPRLVVLAAGGTGVGPRDVTAEAASEAIDRRMHGVENAFLGFGQERVPSAMLSRCVAGTRRGSIVVALPGSPGAAPRMPPTDATARIAVAPRCPVSPRRRISIRARWCWQTGG